MDEISFERRGAAGLIVLKRPEALNALNHAMIKALRAQLFFWESDDAVKTVVIRGEGRAFCAGGDIRAFHASAAGHDLKVQEFWRDEYSLNAEIKRFAKPYVALLHGISMGGGLGVALHGGYRIADSSLVLAMPETIIGFFPDVGASWFLPRLPGEVGMYLGLTGARLKLVDAQELGLVTHTLPQEKWPTLIDALAAGEPVSDLLRHAATVEGVPALAAYRREIDAAFSAASAEEILHRLDEAGSDWCRRTAETIRSRSPTSVKVAYQALRDGRACARFEDCMAMEYRVACRLALQPDFLEGIRAQIIDKDGKPRWSPPRLEQVREEDVAALFAPLPEGELFS